MHIFRISIIIAVYNADKLLPNLLESILLQDYSNFEIIIIDGGSSDRTVEIIKNYEKEVYYWISEKDKGIYDAWNKGIVKATGDWIMFLGADDVLLPQALYKYNEFINSIDNPNNIDFISSKIEMVDLQGNSIRIKGWPWQWPLFLKDMTVAHPGALHSRKLFHKYGLYDIKYKITGDYELLLRPKDLLKTAFFDEVTVKMSEGGASDSTAAIKEHFKASVYTGGYSMLKASTQYLLIISKFYVKKFARSLGINVYLKK